jgi:hypothetical protein
MAYLGCKRTEMVYAAVLENVKEALADTDPSGNASA